MTDFLEDKQQKGRTGLDTLLERFMKQEAPTKGMRTADWCMHVLVAYWRERDRYEQTDELVVGQLSREGQKQAHRPIV